MSLSPADILYRLKQLKLWQEGQEKLLKKTKNLMESSQNVSSASDYQTIDGLSAFDSTLNERSISNKVLNIESVVISPSKSFKELLEEKLAEDPGPGNVVPKPKQPFLKKGTGLERFRLTPQPKPKPAKVNKVNRSLNKSERSVTPLMVPDLSIKPKAKWTKIDDSSDHVRKINAELKKNDGPGDQTLYEKQLEKELLIFEALESRANDSSFCSTNSSVQRILSSTPTRVRETIVEEKRVHWESQSEDEEIIETDLERKDIAEILLKLKNLAENNIPPEIPAVIDASEDEKWSSTEPSSGNTSITSTDLETTLKTERRDIGIGTDCSTDNCAICGDKFQKTITEYENRIKEVIEDKNRISELRIQFEQKERDLLKKKREFEDERQELVFQLEMEKKQLVKEKQAFQVFMKESQNRPNKKERQEMSNLKQEVADLTETLKLKDSKNGMTQARLRNQVKQFEKENSNLKDEVEKLTKENAKLSATQKLKRKSADSKILQEINKNITKLAEESRKSSQKSDQKEPDSGRKSVSKRSNKSVLDSDDSFLEMEINREKVDVESQYERTFRKESPREVPKSNGKIERTLDDGSKYIKYPNGNVKTVSPNGNLILVEYFNGDKQETNLLDGTVKYYFSAKNICQTTYADGLEVVEFPEGVTEKRYTDGRCEVTLPDGVVQTTFPDGMQETQYTDGSMVKINSSGEKILLLPNGQKEIETRECKSREYPDGTVKVLYPDGTQETKYANGRVRIKDGNGTLILDTQS